MKILMLNSEYPPLGGGQGVANREIIKQLECQHGIFVDLITASLDKYKIENTQIGEIFYLDIQKNGQHILHQSISNLLSYSIKTLQLAFKLVRVRKYDLIVAWSGVPAGFLASVLAIWFHVPFVVLLRGADVPYHEKRWFWLDKTIFSWLSPVIWKFARAVVANSSGLRAKAIRVSPRQVIQVIPNGIDTVKFMPASEKIPNPTLTLISTGRLSEIKGYHLLISALEGLPSCQLVLIGDGSYRSELERQAKQLGVNVDFRGHQSHTEIIQALQKADVFVLPSLNEGMSNSLLEAIACGLPVIATNVGGSAELVQGNGYIVPTESIDGLKEAIIHYLQSPELISVHRKRSRQIAEQTSWSIVTNQFVTLFRNCLAEKKLTS